MRNQNSLRLEIVFALKQAEAGVSVADVCRKMGISEATFYHWEKKYGGLGVSELRKLWQLEADLSLDKQMLQDILKKSSEAPPSSRRWP